MISKDWRKHCIFRFPDDMERNLSVIIVPHDNAKTRNYRVSYRLLYTLCAITVVFLGAMIFFLATYGGFAVKAHNARRLEQEKAALLGEVAQIDSLRQELLGLQALGIQIKKMMGVDLSPTDSLLVAKLSAVVKSPAINDVENPMDVGKDEQKNMLKAVPSMWPLRGYVTKEFYTTGGEKSAEYHPGIDIAAKRNTPIIAPAEGVAVTSTWDDTYGYMIVIDHGFGIYTLYGHNARNLAKAGERVAKGQTIGYVGNSGKSTAPHLHFEIKKNGIPVNPREYLLK